MCPADCPFRSAHIHTLANNHRHTPLVIVFDDEFHSRTFALSHNQWLDLSLVQQ
jgi:hypothetical protein